MDAWVKYFLFTVLIGVPAFFLSNILWPPSPTMMPAPAETPFYILLSAIESAMFGFGIGFLWVNWGKASSRASALNSSLPLWALISLTWVLVNWWPHDNLHKHNGDYLFGLLFIEYGFHVTVMIAGTVLAVYLLKEWNAHHHAHTEPVS